ncbi:MAG: glycosyltransferase, partial [Planctomycetia bacterium]
MRFALVCNDTHGGIQPYVALGLGLQRAGHAVTLIAPRNFSAFVAARGLPFFALTGDVQAVMDSPEHAAVADKGFLAAHAFMIRKATELIHDWTRDCLTGCDGADVVVAGIGGMPIAEGAAEKLGARFVQAHLQPLTSTGAFPGALAPGWLCGLGGTVNQLTHSAGRQAKWQPLRPAVNAARRSVLNLPPAPFFGRIGKARRPRDRILYGFSRHVLPPPVDWGPRVDVTGYWFLDAPDDWRPPAALSEFLAAGPPPLVVGFGSMRGRDPAAMAELVVAAVTATGRRAVLLSGWGGLKAIDRHG